VFRTIFTPIRSWLHRVLASYRVEPVAAPPKGATRRNAFAAATLLGLALSCTHAATGASCAPLLEQVGRNPANALEQLLQAVPTCQRDPVFLAELGQRLNQQGRYLEAADHLERALMLEPALKDAQLSYAIALAGSGDTPSATALLQDLLNTPDLPATLRAPLERQLAALARTTNTEPTGWRTRFSVATRVGYDSNLLGSPNLESLTLTLPGQNLVLPLDPSYLAQGGGYARVDALANLQRHSADGVHWELEASLRSRASPALPQAGSTQTDVVLERSHMSAQAGASSGQGTNPAASGSYYGLSLSDLQAQSGLRYQAWGVVGGWAGQWNWSDTAKCSARAGLEWQDRSYPNNPLLSGRYKGLSLLWACEHSQSGQWQVGIKTGSDEAQDTARAGGNQAQSSIRLAGILPLASIAPEGTQALPSLRHARVLADLEYSQQSDASGYSPLLESGMVRSAERRAARLEYQHPLGSKAEWVIGLDWAAQASSLALFAQDSRGAYTGVRLAW